MAKKKSAKRAKKTAGVVAKRKSAVATGAACHVLAGRPSKPSVIAIFGTTGYTLSWVARAQRLRITPEKLCERFKANPEGVKAAWAALSEKM